MGLVVAGEEGVSDSLDRLVAVSGGLFIVGGDVEEANQDGQVGLDGASTGLSGSEVDLLVGLVGGEDLELFAAQPDGGNGSDVLEGLEQLLLFVDGLLGDASVVVSDVGLVGLELKD